MISAPLLCMMRRIILIAASWPSKREAAVTILILSSVFNGMKNRLVLFSNRGKNTVFFLRTDV